MDRRQLEFLELIKEVEKEKTKVTEISSMIDGKRVTFEGKHDMYGTEQVHFYVNEKQELLRMSHAISGGFYQTGIELKKEDELYKEFSSIWESFRDHHKLKLKLVFT